MPTVITSAEQVTPEWLSGALRRAGVLTTGAVVAVQAASQTTFTAASLRLVVTYSVDARCASDPLPASLFLKLSTPDTPPRFAERESAFYTRVAAAMSDPPVPVCYDAVFSPDSGRCHILLEDLSATHLSPASFDLPLEQCEAGIDCLARCHSAWWDHPQIGELSAHYTPAEKQEYLHSIERTAPQFMAALGDRLPPDTRALYERVIARLPDLWEHHWRPRLSTGCHVTLIHGDSHWRNFMFARDPSLHSARLIDWQFWGIGVCGHDLAHAIALRAEPAWRAEIEVPLLRRYLERLAEGGVTGYTWDDLWLDYRAAILDNLFMPMWQWSAGYAKDVWWGLFDRVVPAYQDLGCGDLGRAAGVDHHSRANTRGGAGPWT